MPIELVIYLCIGIICMAGVIVLEWFLDDKISGAGIGTGFLVIFVWPIMVMGFGAALISAFSVKTLLF